MLVYVRPSNEALLRARVPGAQGIARPSFFFLYPFSPVLGSGQGCPRLRASNEHIPIVRVLRARRAPGRYPIPSSAELIPRIALFDRPEHRLFEFLQRHVLRIAQGL